MAELTEYGFERDNRTDVIKKLSTKFRNKFGNGLLLTDDSVAGILLAILAEGRLEQEKLAEDVYYTRTLNGAEGVYLDDALSYYNFPRLGKIKGTGTVHVNYNNAGTLPSQGIDLTRTFSADNGIDYVALEYTTLSQNVTGFYLDASTLSPGSYEFSITNTETLDVITESFTIASATQGQYEAFCDDIVDFWLENTTDNTPTVDRVGTEVYVGYSNVQEFTGITEGTFFDTSPPIGLLWSGVDVEAKEAGYNELEAGGISGMSPDFSGYEGVTNVRDFYPGSENETDAEYRSRFKDTRGNFPRGTRESLLDALRDVSGVSDVMVYDNPSLTDITEAEALTFNTVVRGGNNQDIAQTIYSQKPINTYTSGIVNTPVATSDNDTEVINFTKASPYLADIRITYKLGSTLPLSSSERQTITDSINALLADVNIGDVVFNTQLMSAVLSPLKANRLVDVKVETKKSTEPEPSFGRDDITPLYFEYVETNDIVFDREI